MIENFTNRVRGWALKVAGGLIDFSGWLGKRTAYSAEATKAEEVRAPLTPVPCPLSPDARKGEVFYAVLHGGAMDGAVIPVAEGVRAVAVLLVPDETTGWVEAYERRDGRFVTQGEKLVGVYRWQMTVCRMGSHMGFNL